MTAEREPDRPVTERVRPSPSGSTIQRLLDLILSGDMHPGDRLPAERTLTETLGVGRSAVREAIAALEILGFVETRGGSGTYLRAATSELLPKALNWGMMLSRHQTDDLDQVRAGLEVLAIELATPRYTPERLAELQAILARQYESRENPEQFVEADSAFHRHIAATAGNPILEDLLSTSRSLLRIWFEKSVHKTSDMEDALREHTSIYDALASGNSTYSASAMRLHMMTAHARVSAATPSQGE